MQNNAPAQNNDIDSMIEHQSRLLDEAKAKARFTNPDDVAAAMEARRLVDLAHSAGSIAHHQSTHDLLVARRAARDAAIDDHATQVELNRAQLDELAAQLAAERAELAAATSKATAAIAALYEVAGGYQRSLVSHANDLRDAGMPAEWVDGDIHVRHQTGGYTVNDHGKPALVLAGVPSHRLEPQAIIRYATNAALASQIPGFDHSNKRGDAVHKTLDPLTKRPKPLPLPAPEPGVQREIPQSVSLRQDGSVRYDDGTVVTPEYGVKYTIHGKAVRVVVAETTKLPNGTSTKRDVDMGKLNSDADEG